MMKTVALFALFMGVGLVGCGGDSADAAPEILIEAPEARPAVDTTAMTRTESGLLYRDLVVGDGYEASPGQTAEVHYAGWLMDAESHPEWTEEGDKFDATLDRGETFSFLLGAGRVIRGWDEGVVGMKVGGVRRLVVPADLAYGAGGRPPIPPNATLLFDVQLVRLVAPR